MQLIFRPLTLWPGKQTTGRKRASFRAGYNATLQLLDTELRHLRAQNVVLQVALMEDDIRLDGAPRANANPPLSKCTEPHPFVGTPTATAATTSISGNYSRRNKY